MNRCLVISKLLPRVPAEGDPVEGTPIPAAQYYLRIPPLIRCRDAV